MNDAVAIPAFVPGFVKAMPGADYHRVPAMSSSGAKKMIRSPQHYRVAIDTPSEPTDAMLFGTAVHVGVLEPDRWSDAVTVTPEFNKRTTAGRAEWEAFKAERPGRIILTPQTYLSVRNCVNSVRFHPIAAKLINDAEGVEESLFWMDGKWSVPCKARWDLRSRGGLVDLKTTTDASPDAFARSAATYFYHLQEAFYRAGAEAVLNESPRFFAFIAVETEPPHAVACYYLPPEAVRVGQGWMDVALERYAKALASGEWPSYPTSIEQLPFPRWAMRINT